MNGNIFNEIYLFEDLFVNALSGRSINCNISDDSSIYKVKSKNIIEKRLNKSLTKQEAVKNIKQGKIAYKFPNITIYLDKILQYYPKHKIIVIKREVSEVFDSIIKKRWFTNDSLINNNIIWPYYIYKDMHIPHWVKKNDFEKWYKMDELNRCAYYYIRINKPLETLKDNIIKVQYIDLIKNPFVVASNLCNTLNLQFGDKTKEILDDVKFPIKKREQDILNNLDKKTKEEVKFYSEAF